MRNILTFILALTCATFAQEAATGDFVFRKKAARGYESLNLTPDNGKVLGWSGGTLANVTMSGGGASVSDDAYNSTTWDAVTTIAPSKNSLRDKFVSVDTANGLKANLSGATFTGAVSIVADGDLSTTGENGAIYTIGASAYIATEGGANISSSGNLSASGTVTGSNLSGTNTGDNATNTQYSGLAASKANLASPTFTGTVTTDTLTAFSASGTAITGDSDTGFGIRGTSDNSGGTGVLGSSTGSTGSPIGVWGDASYGIGLKGTSEFGTLLSLSTSGGVKLSVSNPGNLSTVGTITGTTITGTAIVGGTVAGTTGTFSSTVAIGGGTAITSSGATGAALVAAATANAAKETLGTVRKITTGDVSRASTSTFADDATLQSFAVEANTWYLVEFALMFTSTVNGGIKTQILHPALATSSAFSGRVFTPSSPTDAVANTSTATTLHSGTVARTIAPISGYCRIRIGASGGNISLQWAQNVSHADNTTLLAGSLMTVTKL